MNARTLTILAALAALATGCVENDASIRMFGLCSPPTPSSNGGCLYPATCTTLALGRLEADVASTSIDGPLVWPIQVNNQRASNADRAGGTETAYASIQGYRIKYGSTVVNAPDQDAPALPGEHPINPGGSTVVLVPIITKAAGTLLSSQLGAAGQPTIADLTAEIRAYGQYGDGSSFETGPFEVQATVCNGCILDGDTNPAYYCRDPDAPRFVAACPQERQRSVPLCKAAAAP